jgi:hypothetical protein
MAPNDPKTLALPLYDYCMMTLIFEPSPHIPTARARELLYECARQLGPFGDVTTTETPAEFEQPLPPGGKAA